MIAPGATAPVPAPAALKPLPDFGAAKSGGPSLTPLTEPHQAGTPLPALPEPNQAPVIVPPPPLPAPPLPQGPALFLPG